MALTVLKGKRKPRGKDEMIDILATAQRLYLETGGQDIDFGITAAKQTYELAMQRARRWIPPENGRGQDPLKEATKALRELRMFQQMRAKSMKVCRETIEETKEAEKLAKAEGAKDEPVDEPEPQEAPAEFFEADESEEPVTVPETATPEELHDQKSS